MKPFLGIDLTTDKKNWEANGEVFVVATPDEALSDALEDSEDDVADTLKKSELPLPIQIGCWVCGAVGVLIVGGILSASVGEDGITLGKSYQALPWLFWLGGVCLVLWALLKVIGGRKKKTVLETEQSVQVANRHEKNRKAVLSDLEVPPNAREVDIMTFFYKVKNGEIKLSSQGLQFAPYSNLSFYIFADAENLYLANLEEKYAIPLSAMKAIRTIKTRTLNVSGWNKDEEYKSEIYKKYKLREDQYGSIICKYHHILEFEHDNELWGMYFPCYELPVIEELTGLKADIL